MTLDEELKQAMSKLLGQTKATLVWVEVLSVNTEEKTMDAKGVTDGLEFYDIQLGAGSVILYPKSGSLCLVGIVEGQSSDAFLISATEVEKMEITASAEIVINGGSNGGLINIGTLTDKINELVRTFNGHTHQVSTTGSATAQTGTAAAVTSKASELNKQDYEDTKVTH